MHESIVIIGAGPAGSVAAILLARAGAAVKLIEQHRLPRDKVCGECLSALAIDVLERIGAIYEVRRAGAIKLQRAMVYAPNGSSLKFELPRPMLGVSRLKLDALLLNLARRAGATIREHVRCEEISATSLTLRGLSDNQITRLSADRVISATGKAPNLPREIGVKAHFEQVDSPRDAIALFGVRNTYGGIAPIENGQFNISFSVPIERINRAHGQIDAMFCEMIDENRALKFQMRRARRLTDWMTAPLHRFGVRDFDAPVIPIGNAAASIEPIGGEGIGLAMRSAELAAHSILNSKLHQLRGEYKSLWRTRRFACRAAAMILSRPALANFLIDGFDGRDAAFTAILRLIGKSPAFA